MEEMRSSAFKLLFITKDHWERQPAARVPVTEALGFYWQYTNTGWGFFFNIIFDKSGHFLYRHEVCEPAQFPEKNFAIF